MSVLRIASSSLLVVQLLVAASAKAQAPPVAPTPSPVAPVPPSAPAASDPAAPGPASPDQAAPGPSPTQQVAPATGAAELAPEAVPVRAEAERAPVTENPPSDESAVVDSGSGLFEASQSVDASAAGDEGAAGSALPFELNGYVRGDVFIGKVPGFGQGLVKAAYGELALKFRTKKEPYGDAFAETRLRYGQQGRERALHVDLREAYVNAYLGVLDLRLGHQIVVWGRADAFNPTNNLTPIDLRVRSPFEDDRRLANVGARAFLNFAPVRLEGVWMPLYRATEYPTVELPRGIVLAEPTYPAPELEKGLGAGRVHLELPEIELSASFLRGYAPLPGLSLLDYTVGVDPTVIRITRTAYDQQVIGFDFSTAIGDLLAIRGEAAYRRPVDYENRAYAPRPDYQYVLGVDRAFGSVSVIAQYLGRFVEDWEAERGPETPVSPETLSGWTPPLPADIRQQVDDAITSTLRARNQIVFAQTAKVQHLGSVRIEWLTWHDTLSLSALGMLNFTTKEWLVYPRIGYQISDALSTSLGAEIYMGPDDTLFGLIDQELSAGYAELRMSF